MTTLSVHAPTAALPTLRVDPEPDVGGPKDRVADAPPGPGPAKSRNLAGIVAEVILVTVSLSASVGVARLIQGGLGHSVVLPMVASVVAGGLVSGFSARSGLPVVVAAVLGLAAVALVTLWTVSPGRTLFGIPTISTIHAIAAEIHRARAVMGSNRTPVPAVPGVMLIASASAGAVCVAARISWEISRRFRRWPRLLALAPPLGMFCYSAPLSARIDRPQTAILFLVTGLAFLAASDSAQPTMRPAGAYDRVRGVLRTYLPMVASTAAALLVLVVAAGALSGTVPVAFPWWDNLGSGPPGSTQQGAGGQKGVSALSMVADLRGAETSSSNARMFLATTAVPTYWQVGILDDFDGTKWVPGPDEGAALSGTRSAGVPAQPDLPPISSTFISRIDIQDYSGRLLPAPPYAQAIDIPIQSVVISDSLGIVTPSLSTAGETYDVVAAVPSVPALSSGPTSLTQIYAGLGGSLDEYLRLPGGIPSQVAALAHQIVVGAKTPLQEAQALVDYFHNGSYVYTLSPPPTPAGQNPLLAFLTLTRAGFCQQFAGAYGVMARELGLPVRLAIGFTTGTRVSKKDPNQYQVTGADAHVWPQVYLGSQLGWVSFEPTPSPPNGEPDGTGVVNARSITPTKATGGDGRVPKKPTTKIRIPLPPTPKSAQTVGPAHTAKHSKPLPAGLIVGTIGLVVAALAGFALYMRSKRYVRPVLGLVNRNSTHPDDVVLRSWMRASNALGRAGLQRSQWSTPSAHAAYVRIAILEGAVPSSRRGESSAALGAATYGYAELAELAELACYCPGRCSSRDARHAEQEAWRIERALRSSGMFRRFPAPPPRPPVNGGSADAGSGDGRVKVPL